MIPCILARTWTLTAGFLDQSAICLGVPLAHQDVRTGLHRKETMALVSVEVQVIPSCGISMPAMRCSTKGEEKGPLPKASTIEVDLKE